MWYEGTSHRYISPGTKVKIIDKGQGQISGSCLSSDGCFGVLVFHKHILFNWPPEHFVLLPTKF